MTQETDLKALTRAQKREAAVRLRLQGEQFAAIGRVLGISTTSAFRYVASFLKETEKRTSEDAEQLRQIQLLRANALIKSLWPERSNPRAADSILRAMDREAKLTGIDAPERREVSGPDGAPLAGQAEWLPYCVPEELEALEKIITAATARMPAVTPAS